MILEFISIISASIFGFFTYSISLLVLGFLIKNTIAIWLIEKTKKWIYRIEDKKNFKKIKQKMPKLIEEIKDDIKEYPLKRKCILFSKRCSYCGNPNDSVLVYYYEDHNDLEDKFKLLENNSFVISITFNNITRYEFTEKFIELL